MEYKDITRLDWEILDSLSDDYESIEQIHQLLEAGGSFKGDFALQTILDRIELLYASNYVFLILNETFDRSKLQLEIEGKTGNRPYWFGLTNSGCAAWEACSERYGGEPIDWSSSWTSSYSLKNLQGHVDGASVEVCLEALDKILPHDKEWEIDRESLGEMPIEGFDAKYYKHIKGGHRIKFRIKKVC